MGRQSFRRTGARVGRGLCHLFVRVVHLSLQFALDVALIMRDRLPGHWDSARPVRASGAPRVVPCASRTYPRATLKIPSAFIVDNFSQPGDSPVVGHVLDPQTHKVSQRWTRMKAV